MGIIHTVLPFNGGGLKGIQACQRDWSNYLVHFTSAAAMDILKIFPCKQRYSPKTLVMKVEDADKESFKIVKKIQKSMSLRSSQPKGKNDIDKCVCFSECNLPGLINHCERYGRFGFVFKKDTIFRLGGRPTMYLDRKLYTKMSLLFKKSNNSEEKKFYSLLNVFSPPGDGEIQDFTIEREWRLFSDLSLKENVPEAILCPRKYYNVMSPLFGSITIPIDLLVEWGL